MAELDATQLLEQLRDIHQPAPPSEPAIWPIAIALLIIGTAIVALILRHWKRRQRSWLSAALQELDSIQHHANSTARLHTAELLKRIVLTHDNNADIRKLHGNAWLRHLDQFFKTRFFSEGDGRIYGDTLYQPNTNIDSALIYKKLRKLIKRRNRQS